MWHRRWILSCHRCIRSIPWNTQWHPLSSAEGSMFVLHPQFYLWEEMASFLCLVALGSLLPPHLDTPCPLSPPPPPFGTHLSFQFSPLAGGAVILSRFIFLIFVFFEYKTDSHG